MLRGSGTRAHPRIGARHASKLRATHKLYLDYNKHAITWEPVHCIWEPVHWFPCDWMLGPMFGMQAWNAMVLLRPIFYCLNRQNQVLTSGFIAKRTPLTCISNWVVCAYTLMRNFKILWLPLLSSRHFQYVANFKRTCPSLNWSF